MGRKRQRLRKIPSVHEDTGFSIYLGTCRWCEFYDHLTETCVVDHEWSAYASRCDINDSLKNLKRHQKPPVISAHERAELLLVKMASYERGLHFFTYLDLAPPMP